MYYSIYGVHAIDDSIIVAQNCERLRDNEEDAEHAAQLKKDEDACMQEAKRQVYAAYWLTIGVLYLVAMHFVCVVYSFWQEATDPSLPYGSQVDE